MNRWSPGERAYDMGEQQSALIRAHAMACVALNLLMDARKELWRHGNVPEMALESYRAAKCVETLADKIEWRRRKDTLNHAVEGRREPTVEPKKG